MYIVEMMFRLMNVKLEKELGQEGVRRPDDEGSGLPCAVELVQAVSRASLAGRRQEGEERRHGDEDESICLVIV